MKNFYLISSIIFGNILFNECLDAKQISDKEITNEVKYLLSKEADIPIKKLNIATKNGTVFINGVVETRLQADKIIELANSIDNVQEVNVTNLNIISSNQYITDAYITSAVKGKIIGLTRTGKIGKNFYFNIETTNGNVHIFGKTENQQDTSVIAKEVREIKGIKKVHFNVDEIE